MNRGSLAGCLVLFSQDVHEVLVHVVGLRRSPIVPFQVLHWCGVVWCGVVWCGVVLCGVVWCGVVLCGVEQFGAVWCGVMWCGVV